MQCSLIYIGRRRCKGLSILSLARRTLTPSRASSSWAMRGVDGLCGEYVGIPSNQYRMLGTLAAPTSRKKRKKALEASDKEAQPTSVTNFTAEAEKLLDDIHTALLPFEAPTYAGFKMTTKTRRGPSLDSLRLCCLAAKTKVCSASKQTTSSRSSMLPRL